MYIIHDQSFILLFYIRINSTDLRVTVNIYNMEYTERERDGERRWRERERERERESERIERRKEGRDI